MWRKAPQNACMASNIEVLIFDGDQPLATVPHGTQVVPLSGGLSLLPVTRELLDNLHEEGSGGDGLSPGWALKDGVARLACLLSSDR